MERPVGAVPYDSKLLPAVFSTKVQLKLDVSSLQSSKVLPVGRTGTLKHALVSHEKFQLKNGECFGCFQSYYKPIASTRGWSKKVVCKDSQCISTAHSSPEGDSPWVPSEESSQSPELGQKVALNFPRRRLQVSFTCNACGERSQRLVNPHAYARGTVFVQCAGCEVYHKLVDNLGLIEEIDYRLESDPKTDESEV